MGERFTYLFCCAADNSNIFSVVLKNCVELSTVAVLLEETPKIQKEIEEQMGKTFKDFGILCFTLLKDEK